MHMSSFCRLVGAWSTLPAHRMTAFATNIEEQLFLTLYEAGEHENGVPREERLSGKRTLREA